MSAFEIGIAMFIKKASILRTTYATLYNVLITVESINKIKRLPKQVNTLRRNFRLRLLLVLLRRKKVDLNLSKILARVERQA